MNARIVILILCLLVTDGTVFAQSADSSRSSSSWEVFTEVTLLDGSRLLGHVVSRSDGVLTLRTISGATHEIELGRILRERTVRGRFEAGVFYAADPNISRTFFAPTARAVPKGSGYMALHELFFLNGAYGVGSGITLSAGTSLFPGAEEQLVWLAPKVTVLDRSRLSIGAGALVMGFLGSADAGGIFYGVVTYGSQERALTVGTGFFFGDGDIESTPVVQFSGDMLLSRGVKLISENYMMPGLSSNMVSSLGLRFIVTPRFTLDLAGFTVTGEAGAPLLPWVGISAGF